MGTTPEFDEVLDKLLQYQRVIVEQNQALAHANEKVYSLMQSSGFTLTDAQFDKLMTVVNGVYFDEPDLWICWKNNQLIQAVKRSRNAAKEFFGDNAPFQLIGLAEHKYFCERKFAEFAAEETRENNEPPF